MEAQKRQTQKAYEEVQVDETLDLDRRIEMVFYKLAVNDLGRPESVARDRAKAEVAGTICKSWCDEFEKEGLQVSGRRVLELGAGLGGVSVELARRGSDVIAMEPGSAWRKIAGERLAAYGSGHVIGGTGEAIPLADASVDLVVSIQVLEHVQDPARVVREIFRVLKPGGKLFLAYENYLSFWEPHYRVPWFPLLPKTLGALYLRALGRDPRFLLEAVTYTTFHDVRAKLLRIGFKCQRMALFEEGLSSPSKTSPKWRVMKAIAAVSKPAALSLGSAISFAGRFTKTAVIELMEKPAQRS